MSPTPKLYVARDGTRTWRVRFRLNGKNTSETFPTEKAALNFCHDIGRYGPAEAQRIMLADLEDQTAPTLDELFEEWIVRAARRHRSDRTAADNRAAWERWVSPRLGSVRVTQLVTSDVQGWVDWMVAGDKTRKPSAPKSVADRHAILHGVVKWAMSPARAGGAVITTDPCNGVELPVRRRGEIKGMQPAEWDVIHTYLRRLNEDAADLALFLIGTGWRVSEAIALMLDKVEDDGMVVHVLAGRVARRNAAGQTEIVPDTKTRASRRRVLLDDEVAAMVRRRVAGLRHATDLVFTTSQGSMWRYNNFAQRFWHRAQAQAVADERLARRFRVHEARHSAAGWMLMAGASLADVQAQLGHESPATTMGVYGSLVRGASPTAVAASAAFRASGRVVEGEAVRRQLEDVIDGEVVDGE